MRLLCAPSPLCLAYCCGLLFGDDDCNAQRGRLMVSLKFVVLTFGAFLRTVGNGATMQYHKECIQQACEERGTLFQLNKRI